MCLQRVGSLAFVHVERKGFQIVFFLRWIRDRRLRALAERIVLDAVFFCRGDILRKSTGISVQRDARREHRIVAPVLDHGSFGVPIPPKWNRLHRIQPDTVTIRLLVARIALYSDRKCAQSQQVQHVCREAIVAAGTAPIAN